MKVEKKIKVVYIEPGRDPEFRTIDDSLEGLRSLINGHIESLTVTDDMVILCDEEGRLKGLPVNRDMFGITLVGPIVLAGVDGENFADVPVEDLYEVELFGGEV